VGLRGVLLPLAMAGRGGRRPSSQHFGAGDERAGERGLRGDAMAAGQARVLCILIGVAIGTTFMLILSSDRVGRVSEPLLKRSGGGAVSRMR
jgi:hypothetical protein